MDTIRDCASLQRAVQQGKRFKYLFFWGHQSREGHPLGKECLSQWWPAAFTLDDIRYPTAEHYMMAEKARLFGDEETRARILQAPHPGAAKRLGRQVQSFDEATWAAVRFDVVVRGNESKFSQDDRLKSFLLGTRRRILVEASPLDRVWGIGLAAEDRRAANPELWSGLNLLGFALMEVRARLQSQAS